MSVQRIPMKAVGFGFAVILLVCSGARAGSAEFEGQFSAWATIVEEEPKARMGGRYLPQFSLAQPLSTIWELSAEAAANARGLRESGSQGQSFTEIDLYRFWIRLASPQFETRAGLQKISMGQAILLRPMMWFDTLDPRDPLQLTEGVYGLSTRYSFLNNASLQAWGLHGNDTRRGWDAMPSDNGDTEWGGRLQTPLGPGEIALSYHRRHVDSSHLVPSPNETFDPLETRLGIDGKWDLGIGLWFEATETHLASPAADPSQLRQLTVGADYTFGLGNGLHVLTEHLQSRLATVASPHAENASVSGLSINYPLNVLDRVSFIAFYDWDRRNWNPFIQWTRSYDRWKLDLSVFRNSRASDIRRNTSAVPLNGSGFRVMLIFNH